MPTITYTGNSIPSKKVVTLTPPAGVDLSAKEIQIGLGTRLLTFTGYVAQDIADAWAASEDALLSEIAVEASGDNLVFTHNDSDADFDLTVLVDGSSGLASAVHRMVIGNGATGGTFTLTFLGQTTAAITYVPGNMATTAANALAALNNLSNVAPGDVVVSSPAAATLDFAYAGAYLGQAVTLITGSGAGLTGGNATILVATPQQGSAGQNEQQSLVFDVTGEDVLTDEVQAIARTNTPTFGEIIYTFDGVDLNPLDFDHSASDLETELLAATGLATLDDPVAGDIEVTLGPLPAQIRVTFTQNYSGINIPEITYTSSGRNEKQNISMPDATSGTWRGSFRGVFTAPIAWDASTAAVESAFNLIATIADVGGSVDVTGSAGDWDVEFQGTLAETDVEMIGIDASNLGGIESANFTQTTAAVAGVNDVQLFRWYHFSGIDEEMTITRTGTVSGGTWRFSHSGNYSAAMAWDAPLGAICQVFGAFVLAELGTTYNTLNVVPDPFDIDEQCELSPATSSPLVMNFFGDAGGLDINMTGFAIDNASLTGGGSYALSNSTNGGGGTPSEDWDTFAYNVDYDGNHIALNTGWTAAQIKTAISNATGIAQADMNVFLLQYKSHATGANAHSFGLWGIQFIGTMAGTAVSKFIPSYLSFTSGIQCVRLRTGAPGVNEQQTLHSTLSSGTFRMVYSGIQSPSVPFGATNGQLQTAIRATHANLAGVTVSGGTIPGVDAVFTFGGPLKYTDVPLLTCVPEGNIGYTVTETEKGSAAPVLDISTLTEGGTEHVYDTVGDSYTMKISVVGSSTYFLVTGIPYDVTNTELEDMINAVMGPGSVNCTGGPHPESVITIEWTGDYEFTDMNPIVIYPTFTPESVRIGSDASRTDHSYELTIIPDNGTLGMLSGDEPASASFFLNFTTDEADETNTSVQISLYNLNPDRIEDAINEHFGRKVCQVTRLVHSQEWAPVRTLTGTYSTTTKKYYVWYYRGVYRITFINEFADPATITNLSLTLPLNEAGELITPYDFMLSETDPPVSGVSDDFALESRRIAMCFQAAYTAGAPIHYFGLEFKGDDTPSELKYQFQINTQFGGPNAVANLARVSLADLPPDLKMKWQWGYVDNTGMNSNEETEAFTSLAESPELDWDASVEQHRQALERLGHTGENDTTDFMGEGNVTVTGSLYGSWMPDPYGLLSTSTDDSFNCLQVTLTGRLANLPLNEYDYQLRAVFINPYAWMANADSGTPNDYRFLRPNLKGHLVQKPVQSLVNDRQRFDLVDVLDDEEFTELLIGYDDTLISIDADSTIQEIQDTLNELPSLGQFSDTIRTSQLISDDDPPVRTNIDRIIPTKMARSVTVFGTDPTLDPFEVEFGGYGFQSSDVQNLIVMGGDSKAIIVQIQNGTPQQPEIQTLTQTPGTFGGTWTLTIGAATTAALQWDISNASLKTAIEGLAGIGAGKVTSITGGPVNVGVTTITFHQSLNGVATIVIVPSLNNGTVTTSNRQTGGLAGSITVTETTRGKGPSFYDAAENYDLNRVPHSEDTLILDDATTPLKYGLDQTTTFTLVNVDGTLMHDSRRRVFLDGQKVWVTSTDTLPTNLAEGYYFVRDSQSDGTFKFAATSGGTAIVPVGNGVGVHSAYVKDLTVIVYARYSGDQIGLPERRAKGDEEYLPCYFKAWFSSIDIGQEDGDSISLGRFNTMQAATQIRVRKSGGSSVDNIPAVLFITDHGEFDDDPEDLGCNLIIDDGEVGLSVYSNESSAIHDITINGGSLLANNCEITGAVIKAEDGEFRAIGNTTHNGLVNEA